MAKRPRETTSAENEHNAETVLNLINSLSSEERRKLFDLLRRHPENKTGNAWWYANALSDILEDKRRRLIEVETQTEQELDQVRAQLSDAQEEFSNSIPKRKMTQGNQETLDHYRRLLKKHANQRGGQMKALKELVSLPSEQSKKYVVKYKESCHHHPRSIGDMEPVRQHVKRLRSTARKRQ